MKKMTFYSVFIILTLFFFSCKNDEVNIDAVSNDVINGTISSFSPSIADSVVAYEYAPSLVGGRIAVSKCVISYDGKFSLKLPLPTNFPTLWYNQYIIMDGKVIGGMNISDVNALSGRLSFEINKSGVRVGSIGISKQTGNYIHESVEYLSSDRALTINGISSNGHGYSMSGKDTASITYGYNTYNMKIQKGWNVKISSFDKSINKGITTSYYNNITCVSPINAPLNSTWTIYSY